MLISPPELAVVFLGVIAAAFLAGIVAFGFGMVISPFLLLIMEPQDVVVVVNMVAFPIYILVFSQTREQFYRPMGLPFALAAIAGVPVGTLILSTADSSVLRLAIVATILVLMFPVALSIRMRLPMPSVTGPLIVWTASVIMSGLIVGGPLIVLFAMAQNLSRDATRAIVSFSLSAISVGTAIAYAGTGLFTGERLLLILVLIPPMLLGFRLSSYAVRRINDKAFHYLVMFIIVLFSITVLGRELL